MPAGSCPTALATLSSTSGRRGTWTGFSVARGHAICRWSSRAGSNWRSILGPPRSWDSGSRRPSWFGPSTWSNDEQRRMSMVLKTLAGAVLFATLCGAPGAAGAQQVIFLIRHAEQMSGPEIVLTEVGHRRAAALAHRLKDAGIAAIFTTDAVRTHETAAPTAKALGIQPKVVRMQDIDGLVN